MGRGAGLIYWISQFNGIAGETVIVSSFSDNVILCRIYEYEYDEYYYINIYIYIFIITIGKYNYCVTAVIFAKYILGIY
jgi:hypothetical protein